MVCVGSLKMGSGFFMKWITCARSGGLVSVVLGGGSLGLPSRCNFLATLCALFCALKPHSIMVLRISLMVEGSVTFKKASDARVPTLGWRWPRSFRILRMRIDTSPKSMSTGHGVSHLWQTVQRSATSYITSKWRMEMPRRVCSSYNYASFIWSVASILLRCEYIRFSRGLCVLHSCLHLPQLRQWRISSM